jgi:hypothetical protein
MTAIDMTGPGLRARVKKTAHPCGCKSGAAATLVALVGWPVGQIVSGLPHSWTGGAAAIGIYAAVVLGSAVAGKVVGIAVGRIEHQRLLRKLAELDAGLDAALADSALR